MNVFKIMTTLGVALALTGCTTSSKVQEMIDASYREQTDRTDAHEASIEVLKKSAMTTLEMSKQNAEQLTRIQAQLKEINSQIKVNKGFAEASKVMSAANTVKVAEVDQLLKENTEADKQNVARMKEIDMLYESVMIAQFQQLADSANAAIESLKADGWIGSSNAPVKIDKPIEIVAPTTVPVTNAVPEQ
ncbi:hypothetical protein P4E94_03610 [Pontiellaceae bacterium B12219]|nr:hypothetical protein [Pontiellaceae bacterium B12219]